MGLWSHKRWGLRRAEAAAPNDEVGQALVRRWRRGDAQAFNDLFRTYRSLVYGLLRHLMPREPDLEDVVQTAFVEVFRSLHRFEGRSKLSSWIARVTLHVGYHHLRYKRRRPLDYQAEALTAEISDDSAQADPHGTFERAEVIQRMYAILETLAEKKRTVFVLNDLEGLPQEEVAEVVGANVATVRTRLYYARKEFWEKAGRDPVLSQLADPTKSR